MKLKNIQFSVIAALLMGVSFIGRAQTTSQKFGENPTVKNEGAVLELESTNKGFILPRVSIANTTTWGLAGTATRGMAIYNINTAITGTTTYPVASGDGTGLYFWDGTGWAATAKALAAADVTKDAWVDDAANTQVKLGTQSDGTARPSGTEFVVKDNGNLGIGEATPSAKLEVNGNVEIQLVDNVQNDISYKPLIWNTNTKRVETTDDNAAVKRSVTVASGATATVGTPLTATSGGAGYEIKLLVTDGCGVSVFSKFIASGSTAGYWRINFIAGISQNGPASGTSTGNGSTVTVKNPMSAACGDGGNSTALDYTISISNSGQVSVTNNGNISKTYILILEKVIE